MRFNVHFTPTGSSWMNQVERWFGLLTDKLIRRGVHTSVKALEDDIAAWIDTWNDNPRPFTWTKTADEIASKPGRRPCGPNVPARNPSQTAAGTFERIHRSNLIGMGVLPLQFAPGDSARSLGLTGEN
jgi:hypothetical protein